MTHITQAPVLCAKQSTNFTNNLLSNTCLYYLGIFNSKNFQDDQYRHTIQNAQGQGEAATLPHPIRAARIQESVFSKLTVSGPIEASCVRVEMKLGFDKIVYNIFYSFSWSPFPVTVC